MSAIHYKESAIGKNILSGVTSECQSLSRIIYTTFLPKATVYLYVQFQCLVASQLSSIGISLSTSHLYFYFSNFHRIYFLIFVIK